MTKNSKLQSIYDEAANPEAVMQALRDLTGNTSDSHDTHNIPFIEHFQLLAGGAFIGGNVFSPNKAIKDGDILISKNLSEGAKNMVFDVEELQGLGGVYKIHLVKSAPEQGIGHP